MKGLSCLKGNFHEQFLGGLAGAIPPGYPAAIVVETVFAVPGVGSFGIGAIALRDYPQVQAFILLFALGFVLVNLAVDILYVFLDPRIKYGQPTN